MNIQIQPTSLSGTVTVPPSKSMAHRAIIAASLAKGESIISNLQLSDDIKATLKAVEALGAVITLTETEDRYQVRIRGLDRHQNIPEREIDAIESGSTLRFMIPIATLVEGKTIFRGRGKLGTRPLDIYETIFHEQGLTFDLVNQTPLELHTEGVLTSGIYEIPGNISSQFITGLLYTLPLLDGDSKIVITTSLESIGYIDLTLDVLNQFGIQVIYDSASNVFSIPGDQTYQATNYTVEGDYSQAAFFLAAGAVGNAVTIKGLDTESKQGDREMVEILERMGCQMIEDDGQILVDGSNLHGDLTIDGSQIPDVIPVLSVACALAPGKTIIKNLERLRIKESDRLEATKQELNAIGADIEEVDDSLHIQGVNGFKGNATTWSHKDHRIAMMLAIASTRCEEAILVKDAEAVNKSYPTFWQDFKVLGGQIDERHMG